MLKFSSWNAPTATFELPNHVCAGYSTAFLTIADFVQSAYGSDPCKAMPPAAPMTNSWQWVPWLTIDGACFATRTGSPLIRFRFGAAGEGLAAGLPSLIHKKKLIATGHFFENP